MLLVDFTARPTAAPLPCPLLAFQILLERPQYLLMVAVSDGRRSASSIPKGTVVAVVVSFLLLVVLLWLRLENWTLLLLQYYVQ